MPEDVFVVPHPEFERIRRQMAIAMERFQQATEEKQGLFALFGSLPTITSIDCKEFVEQIEAEENAYETIKGLHKILRVLCEKDQPKVATVSV